MDQSLDRFVEHTSIQYAAPAEPACVFACLLLRFFTFSKLKVHYLIRPGLSQRSENGPGVYSIYYIKTKSKGHNKQLHVTSGSRCLTVVGLGRSRALHHLNSSAPLERSGRDGLRTHAPSGFGGRCSIPGACMRGTTHSDYDVARFLCFDVSLMQSMLGRPTLAHGTGLHATWHGMVQRAWRADTIRCGLPARRHSL